MVKKIVFSISLCLLISFSVFLLVMSIPNNNQEGAIAQIDYVEIQEKFFLKDFLEDEEKIFIIGSSHTQALNTTEINSNVKIHCPSCQVYNISIQGDNIHKRSKVVDSMVLSKPKMIIYGISENDFAESKNLEFLNKNPILPDIKNIISEDIKPEQYFEFLDVPLSPKDKTWNIIRQLNKDESINVRFVPYPDTPFLKILKASTISVSEIELKSLATNINPFGIIKEPNRNESLKKLKNFINKIEENEIKIVFFIVPHHDYLISAKTEEFKKSFEIILEDLKNSTEVTVSPRITSYSNMPIWHDLSHVAVNDESLIYSKDISELIIKELQS